MRLRDRLNKPEYVFQPSVLLRRLFRRPKPGCGLSVVTLPWGLPIKVRPNDDIGRAIWQFGVYDLPVTEAIWRLVSEGECAVDVGANIGYMTSIMARRVGCRGHVWAFEPHPAVFQELAENMEGWKKWPDLGELHPHQVAVGDRHEWVSLVEPECFGNNRGTASLVYGIGEKREEGSPGRKGGIRVEMRTLAEIQAPEARIGVTKIDVEGHELTVLQGADALLRRGALRDIVFEEHRPYPTEVTLLLEDHGYRLFRLFKGFWGPLLAPPEEKRWATSWLPSSFLATREAKRAQSLLEPRGWQVLSHSHNSLAHENAGKAR